MKKIIAFIMFMFATPVLAQNVPVVGDPLGPAAPTPVDYGTGVKLYGKNGFLIGRYVGKNDSRSDLVELKLGQELVVIPYSSQGWYYSSERLTSKWDTPQERSKNVPPPFALNLPPVWTAHFNAPNCGGQAYSDATQTPLRGTIWNVNGNRTVPGFAQDVTFAWPAKPFALVDLKSSRDTDGKCVNWNHQLYVGKTQLFRMNFHIVPFYTK